MFPPERSIFIFLGPCHKVVLVPQDKIWEHCVRFSHPEELDSLVQSSSGRWRPKVIGGGGLWLSQTPELPARENTAALVQIVRTATRLQRWRRSNAGQLPDALPEHCSFAYSWCLKIHFLKCLYSSKCASKILLLLLFTLFCRSTSIFYLFASQGCVRCFCVDHCCPQHPLRILSSLSLQSCDLFYF